MTPLPFTYGLEFEVEGISPNDAASAITDAGITCDRVSSDIHETHDEWKAVYDGSLSNGAEIVSPVLTAARLNEARKVARVLAENGARVGSSTGYHVHIGHKAFRDNEGSWSDSLATFILNYYAVHHALGALVAPSRLSNRRYCRILTQQEAESEAEYVRNGNVGSRFGDRYFSLNLDALNRHGTVEVRLHQGTLNGVKAIAWVKLIEALVKESKKDVHLYENEALHPWQPLEAYSRGTASVDDCRTLLDLLSTNGSLSASTADWLKGRAALLHG